MKAPENYELEIGEGPNAGFVRVPGQNWREPTPDEREKHQIATPVRTEGMLREHPPRKRRVEQD